MLYHAIQAVKQCYIHTLGVWKFEAVGGAYFMRAQGCTKSCLGYTAVLQSPSSD